MLRSDTTALFERLREANILLQEVLSGAHENMSEIESTLVTRVADFVAAMNEVAQKTGTANTQVEQHIGASRRVTTADAHRPVAARGPVRHAWPLAGRGGRADRPQQPAHRRLARRAARSRSKSLVDTLDSKAEAISISALLARFSWRLLDQSLEGASGDRAREIARLIAEFDHRGRARDRREFRDRSARPTRSEHSAPPRRCAPSTSRPPATRHAMFDQAAERFAEVVDGLKRMTAEMQRELDATRTELRKGILELPQETAESAAQMRRVIVDQIEALAELNRIVARHGRGLDTVEPARAARRDRWRSPAAPHPAREAALAERRPRRAAHPRRVARRHHRHAAPADAPPRRAECALAQPGRAEPAPAHRLAVRPAHPRLAGRRAAARSRRPRTRRASPHCRSRAAATTGRRATPSSRSIRSRSTSPA